MISLRKALFAKPDRPLPRLIPPRIKLSFFFFHSSGQTRKPRYSDILLRARRGGEFTFDLDLQTWLHLLRPSLLVCVPINCPYDVVGKAESLTFACLRCLDTPAESTTGGVASPAQDAANNSSGTQGGKEKSERERMWHVSYVVACSVYFGYSL